MNRLQNVIVALLTCISASSTGAGLCANPQPLPAVAQPPHQTADQILNQIPDVKFKKDLPSNFPVPKYTSNVTASNFVFSTKGSPAATANITTSDSADKVFGWYQQACTAKGWQLNAPTDDALNATAKRGKIYMLQGTRPKEQMSLYCINSKKKAGTNVSITWSKTP